MAVYPCARQKLEAIAIAVLQHRILLDLGRAERRDFCVSLRAAFLEKLQRMFRFGADPSRMQMLNPVIFSAG